MSDQAIKIEMARRAYVAALGTKDEHAKRVELEQAVQDAKAKAARTA